MAVPLNLMPLPGSALATPSARCVGLLSPLDQLGVVVRLRRPARPSDTTAVVRYVLDSGLRVLDVDERGATVDARGSVLALGQAFGVQLRAYAGPDGPFRARRGMVYVPVTLAGIVVAVDGLDERPPIPHAAEARPFRGRAARTLRPGIPVPPPFPAPSSSASPFASFVHPLSAAPRARTGRACVVRADQAGSPVSPPVAGEDHARVVPGGCDEGAAPASLAVVLHLPLRPAPAPLDHTPERAGSTTVSLAPARARRRGPLVAAAAAQRDRRLARHLHPAGVDRS
jgi:hypothetical protein